MALVNKRQLGGRQSRKRELLKCKKQYAPLFIKIAEDELEKRKKILLFRVIPSLINSNNLREMSVARMFGLGTGTKGWNHRRYENV